MNKKAITMAIAPVVVLLLLTSLLLLATNLAALSLNSFDVDSEGRLYVGRLHKVEVYQNQKMIQEIKIPRYRNWELCLQDDDTLLITDGKSIHFIEEDGKATYQQEDTAGNLYRQLRQQRKVIGNDGKEYVIRYQLLRTMIFDEVGECIYQIPLIDVFVKIALALATIGMICVVPKLKHVVDAQLRKKETW